MKTLAVILGLCSFVFFTAGCATHEVKIQESGARLLTQADLEAIFSNEVTFNYRTSQSTGSTTYKPDGTCKVTSGSFSDTGTYWIENGQYCAKWDTIRAGSVRCQRWYKVGDKEFHQVDSTGNLTAKMNLK